MQNRNETKILRDRRKIAFGVIGSVVLVIAGIWLASLDDSRIVSERGFRFLFNKPFLAHGLGWLAIALFGGLTVFLAVKFFDKTAGVLFDSNGITDNSGLNAAGFIPWKEVHGYDIFEIAGQRMLVVLVRDPAIYASRGNWLKRRLNSANAGMVGSPVSISTNTLDIGFDELTSVFEKYYREYGPDPTEHNDP